MCLNGFLINGVLIGYISSAARSYMTKNKCVKNVQLFDLDLGSLQVRQTIFQNIYFFYYRWIFDVCFKYLWLGRTASPYIGR